MPVVVDELVVAERELADIELVPADADLPFVDIEVPVGIVADLVVVGTVVIVDTVAVA